VPGDRGVQADLGLVEPEAGLAELEILFCWPAQPGRADQPGQRYRLAVGQVTEMKGQLTGLQVTAESAGDAGQRPWQARPAAAPR
jgi:hypothetical protein